MVDVNVQPFEIEVRTRHGDMARADVYLPRGTSGRVPVLSVWRRYRHVSRLDVSGRRPDTGLLKYVAVWLVLLQHMANGP